MFGKKKSAARQQADQRVYELHEQAQFLCYINEAYREPNGDVMCMKLEGIVAKGTGTLQDRYQLYDCRGRWKAEITMEELYLGQDSVTSLQGGDKRVALYPREQEVSYMAGDLLCIICGDESG